MTYADPTAIGQAFGEQVADRHLVRHIRLIETGCHAGDAYQEVLGNGAVEDSQNARLAFEQGFDRGYQGTWVDRSMNVYLPNYSVPGYVTRACYHCKARYAKPLDSAEGYGYLNAAVIICVNCIIALSETPATQESETNYGRNATSPA